MGLYNGEKPLFRFLLLFFFLPTPVVKATPGEPIGAGTVVFIVMYSIQTRVEINTL